MGELLWYYCSLVCGSPTRQVWYLIFIMTAPLLLSHCGFFFVFGCGISFLVGSNILLLMVVQQLISVLVLSQEEMSTCASTLPSWTRSPFIEFVTVLPLYFYFFCFFFWPQGMWDPSTPTRSLTHILCIGKRSLNHWTTMKVLLVDFSLISKDVSLLFLIIYFHPHL